MKYVIKPHARIRMRERGITVKLIENVLNSPTAIEYDNKNRMLFKKTYHKNNKERLLLAVAEKKNGALEIITVIDTSKIKKYL